MDTSALHTVTEALSSALSEAAPGDLTAATPCDGWDVADLHQHLLEENVHFARAVTDDDPADATPTENATTPGGIPAPHDTLEATYRHTAARLERAFAAAPDPTRRRTVPGVPGARTIGTLYEMQLCDTVIHTWDLARALGIEPHVDPEIARRVLRHMELVPDSARGAGKPFGPVRGGDLHDGSTLERIILLSGRTP